MVPASTVGVPASGRGVPASGRGVPASGRGVPASGRGVPASTGAAPASTGSSRAGSGVGSGVAPSAGAPSSGDVPPQPRRNESEQKARAVEKVERIESSLPRVLMRPGPKANGHPSSGVGFRKCGVTIRADRTAWHPALVPGDGEKLSAREEIFGDNEALDLSRSLVNLQEFGVAQKFLDGVLFHVTVAAKDLNGVEGRLHGGIGAESLCVA